MKINLAWLLPVIMPFVVAGTLLLLAAFIGVPLDAKARGVVLVMSSFLGLILSVVIGSAITINEYNALTIIIEFDENGALTIRKADG